MRKLQMWDLASALVFLMGAVLFGVPCFRYEVVTPLSGLGALVAVVGVIMGLVKVRCPCCGAFLGALVSSKRPFCPSCGRNLEKVLR
ncbi:hypothetical protein [Pseudoflavonifractor sp. An176]|uniref:hypothetical protein n=1 Tax=Pseudoflavonifractor sp. An176 TaxID=1965572 RepID=UPI00117BD46F|nr:hypothetical protein [Pseudoflavonifractor sp. An176]